VPCIPSRPAREGVSLTAGSRPPAPPPPGISTPAAPEGRVAKSNNRTWLKSIKLCLNNKSTINRF